MSTYTLYFSLFGKKMKTTVNADTQDKAKLIIMRKIVFHKVVYKEDKQDNPTLNYLKDLFKL